MQLRGSRIRRAVVGLAVLLSPCLVASACSSTSTSASWPGTWVPTSGALRFPHALGEGGLAWAPSAKPGGGLVITKAGDSYAATLVSADGTRVQGKAVVQGDDLLVSYGRARYLLLPDTADNPQKLLAVDQGGSTAPQVAATLQPGALAPTPVATNLP
jgi:hypothetical protein